MKGKRTVANRIIPPQFKKKKGRDNEEGTGLDSWVGSHTHAQWAMLSKRCLVEMSRSYKKAIHRRQLQNVCSSIVQNDRMAQRFNQSLSSLHASYKTLNKRCSHWKVIQTSGYMALHNISLKFLIVSWRQDKSRYQLLGISNNNSTASEQDEHRKVKTTSWIWICTF